MKRWKGWRMWLQPFCCFTYITVHSPTLQLPHLHHSSFSNPSIASPTSPDELPMMTLLILQPYHRSTYVTAHSQTLPLLQLHHLVSCPCSMLIVRKVLMKEEQQEQCNLPCSGVCTTIINKCKILIGHLRISSS